MKNIIITALFLSSFNIQYKAQTVTLDQMSQCENENCPEYTIVKDTNNRLNKFTGIWKGTYSDGRIYEFQFIKKENDGGWFNQKFWDKLIGRFVVKNNTGNVLYSSMNANDQNAIEGFQFDKNLIKYQMYYSANAECNDKGYIYLSFPDPNNLNKMKLVFIQDMDVIATCPNGYKTTIPDAKEIILTKQ